MSLITKARVALHDLEKTLLGKVIVAFVSSFAGIFLLGLFNVLTDVANTKDWNAAKAALVALVSAAAIAGLRAARVVFVNGFTNIPSGPQTPKE